MVCPDATRPHGPALVWPRRERPQEWGDVTAAGVTHATIRTKVCDLAARFMSVPFYVAGYRRIFRFCKSQRILGRDWCLTEVLPQNIRNTLCEQSSSQRKPFDSWLVMSMDCFRPPWILRASTHIRASRSGCMRPPDSLALFPSQWQCSMSVAHNSHHSAPSSSLSTSSSASSFTIDPFASLLLFRPTRRCAAAVSVTALSPT